MAEVGPHLNDIGTIVRVRIVVDDVPVDLSAWTITTKQVQFRKPDGTVVAHDAEFTTDGSDGKIQYTTVDGDFDIAGRWFVQGYIVATVPAAGAWHTEKLQIDVFDNV